MSRRAWVYIATVLLIAAGQVTWSFVRFQPASTSEWITFLALVGLATASQLFQAAHGKQSYYPHFVFFMASVFLLQPLLFVCVVLLPHLIEWVKERLTNGDHLRSWYIQPFNIASHLVAGWAAWSVNQIISTRLYGGVSGHTIPLLVPVLSALSAVAVYVIIQHCIIGQALATARGISWRQSGVLTWTSLQPDLIMSCLGYVVAVLWGINPWFVLPALMPLILMYQALMVPQLKQDAQTDGKTGLLNARHFNTLYQAELERSARFNRPMALLMADLDLLRNINNTYGHLAGDVVLAGIGRIIRETVREFDIAGRFGGEEFAIALPEASLEEACALAERVRVAVERAEFKVPNNNTTIGVTMSLGIACYPADARTPTELIHSADIAVYQAKLNGRNCVVCVSDVPHSVELSALPMSDRLSSSYSGNFVPRPTPHANGHSHTNTAHETIRNSVLNSGMLNSNPVNSGPLKIEMFETAPLKTESLHRGLLLDAKAQESSLVPAAVCPAETAVHASIALQVPNSLSEQATVAPEGGNGVSANPILRRGTAPLIMPSSAVSNTPIAANPTTPVEPREAAQAAQAAKPESTTRSNPQPTGLQKAAFPLFIGSVILSGIAFALTGIATQHSIDVFTIGLFVALAVIAEVLQVDLYGRGTVSVSVALNFAAALICGLPGLTLVSAAIVLAHRVRQQGTLDWPALYKTGFNWATHLLAGVAPVLVIRLIGVPLDMTNLPLLLLPVIAAGLAYFFIDSVLIATVVSLVAGDNPFRLWNERYRWLTGHYMVLCVMGLFLAMAYSGLGAVGVLVFTMPIFMMRFAQKQYITQTEHSVRELQRMNEELTHANAEVLAASRTVESLNEELFLTLSKLIDARDPYVGGHASKVADYAVAIAEDLGLAAERMGPLREAGFLHDIGKIAISEAVLHKPARLTAEEYEYVKTHAALGGEFLETCRGLRHLSPFVRHHHERWDGQGYPDLLAGDNIPLEARILAVCDAVEAMASDRPYRKGMSLDEVIAEVKRCASTQFDPSVAASFVRVAEREREHLVVNSAIEVERKQSEGGHTGDPQHPHGQFGNTGPTRPANLPGATPPYGYPEPAMVGSYNGTGMGKSLATGSLNTGRNTGPLSKAAVSR